MGDKGSNNENPLALCEGNFRYHSGFDARILHHIDYKGEGSDREKE